MKKCKFCGRLENDNLKIVEGSESAICSECFEILREDFEEKMTVEKSGVKVS